MQIRGVTGLKFFSRFPTKKFDLPHIKFVKNGLKFAQISFFITYCSLMFFALIFLLKEIYVKTIVVFKNSCQNSAVFQEFARISEWFVLQNIFDQETVKIVVQFFRYYYQVYKSLVLLCCKVCVCVYDVVQREE
eukprot:TRINITY_DN16786_c0_g1_i1.p2 TRINITY_DN16786_c0_g1~~TRINITY_DN16786_c0_g1_i1.p2  ORF type:complete len:134 (-),score=6.52 TRINITY_DN16786_c0_g1_i1:142-543(-)